MMIEQKILKAVLMLRRVNRTQSKEKDLADVRRWVANGWIDEAGIDAWIDGLREDIKQ